MLNSLEKALAIKERLAHENPAVTAFQVALGASYFQIGNLQSATGQRAKALASHERARAIRERLARENMSVTQFQLDLAGSHNNIGLLQNEMGRPADGLGIA